MRRNMAMSYNPSITFIPGDILLDSNGNIPVYNGNNFNKEIDFMSLNPFNR